MFFQLLLKIKIIEHDNIIMYLSFFQMFLKNLYKFTKKNTNKQKI